MGKFKIGDKVRLKNVKVGALSHCCIYYPDMSKYIGKVFTIEKHYGNGIYGLGGLSYGWAEGCLEPAKPETIVIYRNGDKTVALDKTTGKKAEAKCSTEDAYDFYTGAKIAFERLIGEDKPKEEPKPKLYNGKVVCVRARCPGFTKGKIYVFKGGYTKYDDGKCVPMFDPITSFENLEKFFTSEFIDLGED